MARFSVHPYGSYPGPPRADAAPADFSEPPSASLSGGTFSSPLIPPSLPFQKQADRQLLAAAGAHSFVLERTAQESHPSPAMPWSSADAFSLSPPRGASRPSDFEYSGGPGTVEVQTASLCVPSQLYEGDQTSLRVYGTPMFTDSSPSHSAAVNEGVVERRIQTQRPLHRVHPYGSSLFGRLMNKISTSLSALVPRCSTTVLSNTEAKASSAENASSMPTAEATSRQLSYPCPFPQTVYGNTFAPNVNAHTYSLRRSAGPASGHTSAAVSVAPVAPLPAKYAYIGKDAQAVGRGIAHMNTDDRFSLSEQQVMRPFSRPSYQARRALDRGATAGPGESPNVLPRQVFPSLPSDEQQVLYQHQLPPLRQQQQLWTPQQQTDGEKEEARGVPPPGCNVDLSKSCKEQVRVAVSPDPWTEEERQKFLSSLSVTAAGPTMRGAVLKEGLRERNEVGANASEAPPYHFDYGQARQPVLAESFFDSVATDNANVDEDLLEVYGATSFIPSAAQRGVTRRRVFDRDGELLSSKNNAVSLSLTQQQPYLRQKQAERLEKPFSNALPPQRSDLVVGGAPVNRGYLQRSPELSQEQEIISEVKKTLSSAVQDTTDGSLPHLSTNILLYPAAEDEASTKVRRRPLQRGWGGADSSLFSQTLAPAWLSTPADANLPDAEEGRGEREGPAATQAASAMSREGGSGVPTGRTPCRPSSREDSARSRASAGSFISSTAGIFPYPRQEQLTVEQLQKLYLRCQPLRWRVRLRDLLRQEAAVAAAAEKKTRALLLKEKEAAGAASSNCSSTVVSPSGATDVNVRGATEKKPGGNEETEADSSGRRQTAEEDVSADTAEGGDSTAATDEAIRNRRVNRGSTGLTTSEEEQRYGDFSTTGSAKEGSSGSLFSLSNDVRKTPISTAQARKDTSREEEEKSTGHRAMQASKGIFGETERPSGSSGGGDVGVQEENRATTCRGGISSASVEPMSHISLTDAADSKDEEGGGKRSKVRSDKTATEGTSGIHRSLFATDSSTTSIEEKGASNGSSVFGGSNTSLFGSERPALVTPRVAETETKPKECAQREEGSSSSSSQGSTSEKHGVSLNGKTHLSKEGGMPGSLPAPLFGGGSSLFTGLTTGTAEQLQQQDRRSGSSTGKTSIAPSSSFGVATRASSLFGGVRSGASAAPQQVPQPPAAEQPSGSLPQTEQKTKQVTNEQALREKTASCLNTSERDDKNVTGGSSVTEKSAEQTSALPWWQQNLNKPCTVMPEEDFAPEADDEEEAKSDGDTEKALPPLKVPNIFGSSNSTGGLFGAAGGNAPSLSTFKAAAALSTQPSASSSTSEASTARPAATSLFGSAGSGPSPWNQNSSTSNASSLFGSSTKPPAAAHLKAAPAGGLFGGLDSSKQSFSQLSNANTSAPPSLFGGTSSSSGTTGAQQQTSLFSGSTTTGSSTIFATQKASASLFGGSIFGNPVTTSQATKSLQSGAGVTSTPDSGVGLFVFGASGGTKTPSPTATTTTALSAGQAVKGADATAGVPSIFGSSSEQQRQQASGGTGKRSRDAADGGSTAGIPAGKSLFGAPPSGGGLGLFGQRTGTGGSTLFGDVISASGRSLFNTTSSTATSTLGGQTDGNVARGGSTGLTSFLGDKGNNSASPSSLSVATRSATPVFGNSSSTGNKDAANNSVVAPAAGSENAGLTATGNSVGLFGSSSNNNPFGVGGSSGAAGASLFGSNVTKPFDSNRPATTEGSLTTAQPLCTANKEASTMQGLFSLPGNNIAGPAASISRTSAGGPAGGIPNGILQPQRSLFGGAFAGNATGGGPGAPVSGSTTTMHGGLGTASNSLFGNPPPSFTFGAPPATVTAQPQQPQQQTGGTTGGVPPTAPAAGGPDGGNAGNAFFGASSSSGRRPRLTIKRTKQ